MPTVSVATTLNVCAPAASWEYDFGESHGALCPSSVHVKTEPAFVEENWKAASGEEVWAAGPEMICVRGGTVSTVQVCDVAAPGVELLSTERTKKVCCPSANPE